MKSSDSDGIRISWHVLAPGARITGGVGTLAQSQDLSGEDAFSHHPPEPANLVGYGDVPWLLGPGGGTDPAEFDRVFRALWRRGGGVGVSWWGQAPLSTSGSQARPITLSLWMPLAAFEALDGFPEMLWWIDPEAEPPHRLPLALPSPTPAWLARITDAVQSEGRIRRAHEIRLTPSPRWVQVGRAARGFEIQRLRARVLQRLSEEQLREHLLAIYETLAEAVQSDRTQRDRRPASSGNGAGASPRGRAVLLAWDQGLGALLLRLAWLTLPLGDRLRTTFRTQAFLPYPPPNEPPAAYRALVLSKVVAGQPPPPSWIVVDPAHPRRDVSAGRALMADRVACGKSIPHLLEEVEAGWTVLVRDELRRRQALRAWRTVEWDHRARAPKGWTSFHTFVQALQEDPKDRAAGWLLARVAFDRLQEQSVRAVGTEVQEQIRVYPRERQSAFLSHTIRSLIACRTQATVRLAIWLRCASALQSAPRVVEALLNGLWEAHLLPGGPGASETVRRRATSVPNCAGNADVEALCLRAIARYVATGGSRGTAFLTRIKGLESAARTLPSWLEELPLQDPTARAWMEAVIETFTEDASLPKPEVISWFLFHLEPAGSVVPGRVWGTPHWARAALSLEDDGAVAIYLARVAVPWEWLLSAAKSGFLDGKSDARWQQVARALPEPRTGAAWLDPLDDAAGRARLVRLLLCSTTNYGDGISRKAAAARILAENRTARIPLDERYCPDSQVLAALRDLALPGPGARRLSNEEHALAGELTWVVSMRPSIREADLEVLPSLARRADPDAIAHWMAAAMPRAPRVVDLLALGVLRAAVDERVRTNAPTEDESAYVAWLARILTGRWSAFSQARRERPQEMADLLDRWFDPYMPRPTALLLWELREPPTPRPRSSIPRSRMVFLKSPAHVPGGSQ